MTSYAFNSPGFVLCVCVWGGLFVLHPVVEILGFFFFLDSWHRIKVMLAVGTIWTHSSWSRFWKYLDKIQAENAKVA